MLTDEQRVKLKRQIDQLRENFGKVPEEELMVYPAEREEHKIPGLYGETTVIKFEYGERTADRPLFLNFHGGGFIGRRMERDELFCRRMACEFRAIVLDVDYKLAPEYPYPNAVNECWGVVEWMWKNQEELLYRPDRVVLIGHSSGGNLVAGICMRAGETGLFRPCCAVLDYPPLDLATDPAQKERTICDMPAERAREYNRKYVMPEQSKEPYASPLFAPDELLRHFPNTLIIAAGEDSLCCEDEAFALRLVRVGVTVTARRFTESMHGFVINRMCEWESAMALILRFIRQHMDEGEGEAEG